MTNKNWSIVFELTYIVTFHCCLLPNRLSVQHKLRWSQLSETAPWYPLILLCDSGPWNSKCGLNISRLHRYGQLTRPHRCTQTSRNDMTAIIKIHSQHWILGRYFISYIDAFCNQMWVQSNNSNTNITNAVWEPGTGLKQGVHSLYIASS